MMIKRFFVGLACLAVLTTCALAQSTYQSKLPYKQAKGATVGGVVECDGKPVAGVKVSDGYEIVRTDKKGAYNIASKKQNPQVFVCVPAGYEAVREDVVPQFWADFTAPDNQFERHDFKLNKRDDSRHAFVAITDMHLANQRNDLGTFEERCMPVLRYEIEKLQNQGIPVFTFHLGDGSWDSYWYANDFPIGKLRDAFNKVNYPTAVHNVMGNHDNNGAEKYSETIDFDAARPFMKAFGPRYYSFDAGGVHYMVLDNIVYNNEPTDKPTSPGINGKRNFIEEYTPEQIAWMRKDLADVPTDKPIIIAMHAPLFQRYDKDGKFIKNSKTREENMAEFMEVLAPFDKVHTVTGHSHRQGVTRLKGDKERVDHNINASSGSTWWSTGFGYKNICMDGNPAGFEVFSVDGDDFKWKHRMYEYEEGRQFLAWDMNAVKDYFKNNTEYQAFIKLRPNWTDFSEVPENEVWISMTAYDPAGKLKVTQDGEELKVEKTKDMNPIFNATNLIQRSEWLNIFDNYKSKQTFRMYKVKAKDATGTIQIEYTDPFGNVFKERLHRPKAFGAADIKY